MSIFLNWFDYFKKERFSDSYGGVYSESIGNKVVKGIFSWQQQFTRELKRK